MSSALDKVHAAEQIEDYDADDKLAHQPSVGPSLHAVKDKELQGINWKLLLVNLWSLLSPFGLGYSNASIGSSLGQPNFYRYFGLNLTDTHLGTLIGAIVGLASVGGALGCILTVYVQDRYGRRAGFAFTNAVLLLGAALAAGSRNVTMLILGRFFAGFGWAGVLCAVAYQSELAPTTVRGILGGSVGVTISIGYATAAWVSVGFFYLDSTINWRLPLILQVVLPTMVLIGLPFVPESPRWLALNGREDESLAVLTALHYSKNDHTHQVAKAEHKQIVAQARIDKTLDASWMAMIKRYRARTGLIVLITFANQVSGIQIVVNYQTTIYATLGLSAGLSLIVAGAWYIWCIVCECMWCYLIDIVGRRKLLWMGITFCASQLTIMIALIAKYAGNPDASTGAQVATVVWFFVFMLAYCSYEPTMFLYMAEIFPTHVRVRGIALALVMFNLTGFWGTMSQPAGVIAWGWKYYLIFVILNWICGALAYIFVKETKGKTLEEINMVFGDEVAVVAKDYNPSEKHAI